MTTAVYEIIPANGRKETIGIVGFTQCLLLAAFIFTSLQSSDDKQIEIYDWQISAFHDLSATDQAIYNALDLAGEEIFYLQYFLGRWPTMEDIYDSLLPPFYKDLSWRQTGEINWVIRPIAETVGRTGRTAYHGSGGRLANQSSYILIVAHTHAGNGSTDVHTVWLNPDVNSPTPEVVKKESLIRNGWRQIVPYTGDMERKRLKED